jgi:hypothetical protein
MGILRQAITASQPAAEKVPPGFKTCRQWAEEEGLARNTVQAQIAGLVRGGQWVVRKFRVQCGQRVLFVPHYAPKPKAKAKPPTR